MSGRFHLGKRKEAQRTWTSGSSRNPTVTLLVNACAKGHYWETEQQTGHKVCAWCNACEDPRCAS